MANYTLSTLPSSFSAGDTVTVSYTGAPQSFIFQKGGVYKIECYGAQGGSTTVGDSIGGYGGYVVGTYTPTTDTTYYLFVGGKGVDSPYNDQDYGAVVGGAGGYNGGGAGGGGWGAGGGGCSAVCSSSSMSNTSCLLIAGGGGGSYSSEYLSYANARATGTTANIYSSSSYMGAAGTYGSTGCYYYDTFGGGGGYYGGATVTADDAYYAYGGVNYISSTLTSTSQLAGTSAKRTGNGQIVITVITPPKGIMGIYIKNSSTNWVKAL